MENVFEKLQSDIKTYLKSGDKAKVTLIRGIVSKIKDETVNKGKDITDDVSNKCIEKTVKELSQSIDSFKTAGRAEMVEQLENDKKLVSEYLPKQLSEDETRAIIDGILMNVEATKKNMGIIMKNLPKEVNRGVASKILNSILK